LNFQQEKFKEIMMVAKAKGVSEDEIWKMGQMEYFTALNVLERYNKDLKENRTE
jgi:transposase